MPQHYLRRLAQRLGVRCSFRDNKVSLIRAIQARVGQVPCCGTEDKHDCDLAACRWRAECQKPIAVWLR